MSCRIIVANEQGDSRGTVFYDSVTMWAFGPVMKSWEEANLFHNWLPNDPRSYSDKEMENLYSRFSLIYDCSYCCKFFGEMEPSYRFHKTSVRLCESCAKKRGLNLNEAVKEWRYDAEALEFTLFGKGNPDEESDDHD